MDKVRWDEIRWWNGKSIWQWRLHNSISFDLLPRPRRKSTAKRTARSSTIRNLISSTMNARTLMRMETKQRLRWRSHFTQLLHIWQFISIFADASDGSTKAETSQKRETCSRRWFLSKDQEDEMFVYGYKKSTFRSVLRSVLQHTSNVRSKKLRRFWSRRSFKASTRFIMWKQWQLWQRTSFGKLTFKSAARRVLQLIFLPSVIPPRKRNSTNASVNAL